MNRKLGVIRGLLISLGSVAITLGMVSSVSAQPCDPIDQMRYVAMGDSYSSGYGLSDASGDCSRSSSSSFPKRIQAQFGFGSFVDVSCSGAQTKNWTQAQESNPPQLNSLSAQTDVVTFSIGGNDLGFTSILTNCATSFDCRGDYGGNSMPNLLAQIHGSVGDRIEAAMRAVVERAPNAQVFAIGYPDLLPASPSGIAWGFGCLPTSGVISASERDALRNVERTLNLEIEARAAAVGGNMNYVDIYTPSIGHDLCSSNNWTSDLATLFHPNKTGHQAFANIMVPVMRQSLVDACTASTTTTSAVASSTTNITPVTDPQTSSSTVPNETTTTLDPATSTSLATTTTAATTTAPTTTAPTTTAMVTTTTGQVLPARQDTSPTRMSAAAGPTSTRSGSLPRTGSNSAPLAVLGAVMVVVGLALTRWRTKIA